MIDWQTYNDIKNLVGEYYDLKDNASYDEFIKELTDILNL